MMLYQQFGDQIWLLTATFLILGVFGINSFSLDDVHVTCNEDGVSIAINRTSLPIETNFADLHFIDRRCKAHDNGTHIIAHTTLNGCGCGKKEEENNIIYSNVLHLDADTPSSLNSSCPRPSVSIKCRIPFAVPATDGKRKRVRRETEKTISCKHVIGVGPVLDSAVLSSIHGQSGQFQVSSRVERCPMFVGIGPALKDGVHDRQFPIGEVSFVTRGKQIYCKKLEEEADYRIEMLVYSDQDFSRPIGNVIYSDRPSFDVYYQLKLYSDDPRLEIFPTRCYATPDDNPDNVIKYLFIQDGCVLDSTVRFFGSSLKTKRFSIETFRFVGSTSKSFFLHCDSAICDNSDPKSRCAQGCVSKRRKRGSHTKSQAAIQQLVSTLCTDDDLRVIIKHSALKGFNPSRLHLNHKSCKPQNNGTHFILGGNKNHCGTIQINSSRGIEHRNMLYFYNSHDESNAEPALTLPLFCKSESDSGSIQQISVRIPQTTSRSFYITTTKGAWVLTRIISDGRIKNLHMTSMIHTKVTQRNGVLKIVNTASFDDVVLKTMHCSINKSPIHKEHVTLIRHGCPRHSVISYKHSPNMEVLEIQLDKMRWPLAHVKCTIHVCDPRDSISACNSFDECRKDADMDMKTLRLKRDVANLKDSKISIRCHSRAMDLLLPKSEIPAEVDTTQLSLANSSCRAEDLGSHLLFRAPLTRCGTQSIPTGKNIQFFNQITELVSNSNKVIMRRKPFEVPFRCFYITKKRSSETSFRLSNDVVKFSNKGVGSYSVLIKMFTGDDYTSERISPYTTIGTDRDMFFEVGIVDSDLNLGLFLEECYGAPVDAKSKDEKYTFIKNGCKVDSSVVFYPSGVPNRMHFSVKPFKFQRSGADIMYVNCIVSACNADLPETKCSLGCQD